VAQPGILGYYPGANIGAMLTTDTRVSFNLRFEEAMKTFRALDCDAYLRGGLCGADNDEVFPRRMAAGRAIGQPYDQRQ